MKIEEFIDTFAAKVARKFKWSVSEGQIRAPYHKSRVCPATAHYETLHDLGICDVMQAIMWASDKKDGYDPKLREALLTVCGLEEQ